MRTGYLENWFKIPRASRDTGYIIMRLMNNDVYGVTRAADMGGILPDIVCCPVMGSIPLRTGSDALGEPAPGYSDRGDQFCHSDEPDKGSYSEERVPAEPDQRVRTG